jgi:putative oxidoreductase
MNLADFATTLKVPQIVGLILVLAEIAGGVLVLAGSYMGDKMTRLGAMMLIPVLLIVMYMVHWSSMSFTLSRVHVVGGLEYLLVLFLISLYMLLKGNKT